MLRKVRKEGRGGGGDIDLPVILRDRGGAWKIPSSHSVLGARRDSHENPGGEGRGARRRAMHDVQGTPEGSREPNSSLTESGAIVEI